MSNKTNIGSTSFDAENKDMGDTVDVIKLFAVLWRGKWLIASVTLLCLGISILYSLSLPNIYRAKALLLPVEDREMGDVPVLAGQLGGLASIAGLNIGGRQNSATLAIEVIKSRSFATSFIQKHNILVPLMAAKSWNRQTDELVLDDSIYDEETQSWRVSKKTSERTKPSDWDAYKKFSRILNVNMIRETGLVSLSIDSVSPRLAKQWVDWIVADINEHMREKDIAQAKDSIEFLEKELSQTALADMKQVFFQIIEKQVRKMMLANVKQEYVFSVIDPAVVPEDTESPKRVLICAFSVVIGLMLGVMAVVVLEYLRSRSKAVE